MPRRILVPVDESSQSTAALEYVLETFPDAEITALHVINPSTLVDYTSMEGLGMADFESIYQHREDQAEQLLEEVRSIAADYDVDVTTEARTGPVTRTIVDYAAENEIDHVVVGSHGRTGASRVLLGSVAEKIVRRSLVPVTVVR